MLILARQRLRLLHGLLRFLCELVELNHRPLPDCWGARSTPRPFSSAQKFQPFTSIFTWRGLAASFFGRVTVRTPFLNSAPTLSASTVAGTEKLRVNEP